MAGDRRERRQEGVREREEARGSEREIGGERG